nr:hypothetical protein [Tanacetum cinerariifolium]
PPDTARCEHARPQRHSVSGSLPAVAPGRSKSHRHRDADYLATPARRAARARAKHGGGLRNQAAHGQQDSGNSGRALPAACVG